MRSRSVHFLCAVLASLLCVLSCTTDDPTTPSRPDPTVVTSVEISQVPDSLLVRRSVKLAALALNADGQPVDSVMPVFSSLAPAVATVTNEGVVTALTAGRAIVVAQANQHADTVFISVMNLPVDAVAIAVDSLTLEMGETAQLQAVVLDIEGYEIPATVSFSGSDPAVAAVSPNGNIRGVNGGIGWVTAHYFGKLDSVPIAVEVVIAGVVELLGSPPPAGSQFYIGQVSTTLPIDSTPITPQGTFELRARSPIGNETLSAWFRDTRAPPRFIPSWRTGLQVMSGRNLAAALIPSAWVPQSGAFMGLPIDIMMEYAFSIDAMDQGVTPGQAALYANTFNLNWSYEIGAVGPWRRVYAWADTLFPIPIYFDRAYPSSVPVSASDSTVLWGEFRKAESRLGENLFRAANVGDLPIATSDAGFSAPNGIGVSVVPAGIPSGGTAAANGTIVFGSLQLQFVTTARVVMHELFHSLGFSHSCHPSIVGSPSGCSWPNLPRRDSLWPTEYDVAFFQIRRQIAALESQAPPLHFGLIEALEGERLFDRGKPTLGAPFYIPVESRRLW